MPPATDPIAEFESLFTRARERARSSDPTACTLATVGRDGSPSARTVLLKSYDRDGFVFYTNYGSRKAEDLDAHPQAALCFYWHPIGEQVRIEGRAARLESAASDAYFATRPRMSQIGAWASKQSRPLGARVELLKRITELQLRHAGGAIPRPPFWGGYRITPERIEFWSNRPHRLHDRRRYQRSASGWDIERLYP